MRQKAIVIGGGFTGLVAAYFMHKKNFEVHLYESSSKLGGMLNTEVTDFGLVEQAANGIVYTKETRDLLEDIGLKPLFSDRKSKKRFIYREGLTTWPLSFLESIHFLFKLVIYILKSKPLPSKEQNLQDFLKNHFGEAFVNYLASPALSGVYGCHSNKLSASLIISSYLKGSEKTEIISFKNGMQEFLDKMQKFLIDKGVRLHLNSFFDLNAHGLSDSIKSKDWLSKKEIYIVCSSLADLNKYKDLCQDFSNTKTLPLVSATLFFKPHPKDPSGFGCLFPQSENFSSLGVLFNNCIFENRSLFRSETWILNKDLTQKKEDIKELILEDRKRFGYESEFLSAHIKFWPKALPLYDAHLEKALSRFAQKGPVYFCGNYMGGIGLSHIISQCKSLSGDIELSLI